MPEKATMMRSDVSKGPGSRLHECCSKIIAYISDGAVTGEESGMMALTINGQLLTFHFARDHLKFLLGYDEITPERLATLKAIVRRQTTVLLRACRKTAGGR
jgi:hypothetical protein